MFDQLTQAFVDELINRKIERSRKCKDDDLFTINARRVLFKAVITAFLLLMILLFLGTKSPSVNPEFVWYRDRNQTLIFNGINPDLVDENHAKYYYMVRWLFTVVAMAAYMILGKEFIQVSLIVAISLVSPAVYIPIVEDEYVGYPGSQGETGRCGVVCSLFCKLSEIRNKTCWRTFLALSMVLLDIAFVLALLPVVYLVLTSSQNIESQIVDFVAVQVLLTVAHELSKSLFFPRLSMGEKLRFLVEGHPSLDPPRYWPFDRVFTSSRAHNFGVRSDIEAMHLLRDAENYKGFSEPKHWYRRY